MKRLTLCTLSAVLLLAGEPAIGSTSQGPRPSSARVRSLLLAPLGLIECITSPWLDSPATGEHRTVAEEGSH